MKISIVPDVHLNRVTYEGNRIPDKEFPEVNFRAGDFMRAFRWTVKKSIEEKVDLFIIPGDIYDHHSPSNYVRGFFSSQISLLTAAKIPVLLLIGNHDVIRSSHSLDDISKLSLKGVKVVEEPQVFDFKDHTLLLFPYSLEVERKNIKIRKQFQNFVENLENRELKDDILFFGHFGVRGAKINVYTENNLENIVDEMTETTTTIIQPVKKAFVNDDLRDITFDDLDELARFKVKQVFLGDYHRFQTLKTKKLISMYGGSCEKTDINEKDEKKGFLIYDSTAVIDPILGKARFIEYESCRPILDLEGTLAIMRDEFSKIDYSLYKEAIVRLTFKGKSPELLDFSVGLDAFKKEIEENICPVYMYNRQMVKDEEMEEKASAIEKQILDKGHLSETDILEVVKEMIGERITDEIEREEIIKLATEIYGESQC